jgi:hypothetical protein
VKYWPLALLTVLIVAIVSMSRYAEDRKASATAYTQPSSPQISVSPNDAGKTAKNTDKLDNSPSWIETFAWPEGVTAWALLLTLLVIAWQSTETRAAAKATENAVEIADKSLEVQKTTAKQQLRAYMAVKEAKAFLYADGVLEVSLKLHNCGQTPAYELRGQHNSGFSPYPIPASGRPPVENLLGSVSVIGSGNNFNIQDALKQLRGVPVQQTMAAFTLPDFVFVMAGYFTYRDIFKDKHVIKFQLILGGPCTPRWDTDEKGRIFAPLCNDSTGNEAEEDQGQNPN